MRWWLVALWFFVGGVASNDVSAGAGDIEQFIAGLEQQVGGRVGVAALDVAAGTEWKYRANELFPMMSTFKPLACAHMLTLGEQGSLEPNTVIPILETDLVPYAPATSQLVGGPGLTLMELCEATLRTSDNVAANLILREIGGPSALTNFVRIFGDQTTRLDRWEVELNEAVPGDPRDTTTPAAMVSLLKKLLLEDGLRPSAQSQLILWMKANAVSDGLLRSVLPIGWTIADRSGAGQNGSRAISGVVWDADDAPIIVTVYITEAKVGMPELNKAIAQIGNQIFRAASANQHGQNAN